MLVALGVRAIKIASPDLTNLPLLAVAAETGLPLIVSTGAADAAEIDAAVEWIAQRGGAQRLVLLHCVSSYPADERTINLRRMTSIARRTRCLVGLSDHTTGTDTGALAAAVGATVLEKHFTLEKPARPRSRVLARAGRTGRLCPQRAPRRGAARRRAAGARRIRTRSPQAHAVERRVGRRHRVRRDHHDAMLTIKRPGTASRRPTSRACRGASPASTSPPTRRSNGGCSNEATATRRIGVVTGTRAEYGILRTVLRAVAKQPRLDLQLIVTGMHLLRKFGHTIDEIRADGWHIDATVRMQTGTDAAGGEAEATGRGIAGIARAIERLHTDVVLVLGDRIEAFAGASAGAISRRLVAHVHGGDRALGDVDDALRHAITKLSHVHFVATREAEQRVGGSARNRAAFTASAPQGSTRSARSARPRRPGCATRSAGTASTPTPSSPSTRSAVPPRSNAATCSPRSKPSPPRVERRHHLSE